MGAAGTPQRGAAPAAALKCPVQGPAGRPPAWGDGPWGQSVREHRPTPFMFVTLMTESTSGRNDYNDSFCKHPARDQMESSSATEVVKSPPVIPILWGRRPRSGEGQGWVRLT